MGKILECEQRVVFGCPRQQPFVSTPVLGHGRQFAALCWFVFFLFRTFLLLGVIPAPSLRHFCRRLRLLVRLLGTFG